jgi:DNA-binding NarL/FixJ family response regulator
MAIRIILVDDHELFREGLKKIIEEHADLEVVGEAGNGRDALKLVSKVKPDVVVMDIAMPDLNGIEATKLLLKDHPDVKVIVLSMHSDEQFVSELLVAGALGYVIKDAASSELIKAIRGSLHNKVFLSDKIATALVSQFVSKIRSSEDAEKTLLSGREKEILQLLAEGKSTKEIGDKLFISEKTVAAHRQNIMNKLGIFSLPELTKYAIRKGITFVD